MNTIQKTLLFCLMVWSLWRGNELNVRSQSFTFQTLAGNAGYGSADGPTNQARFDFPQGVAADAVGNIYVADTQNSTVRRIDSTGLVTTIAGTAGNTGSADGTGPDARFAFPQGIAADSIGNIYVADTANSTIRRIGPAGVVSTLAGSPGFTGSADGTNSISRFMFPADIDVDAAGTLYVADTYNSTIRMLTPVGTNWVVTTIAGSPGVEGNSDGTNAAARFSRPFGIAVDTNQNVYVADTGSNSAIRRIVLSGTNGVTTTIAKFNAPERVAVGGDGTIYAADAVDNTIRKITRVSTNWVVTVLAGNPGVVGTSDGTAAARFNFPCGIKVVTNGILCVADSFNHTIRKVTFAGTVSTLAGLAGGSGSVDGSEDQARFDAPGGLTIDAGTNLYIADSQNNTIRMITSAGIVTTIAGVATNLPGSRDGNGTNASFNFPIAVAVDRNGNVYVADCDNNTIRKLTPNGKNWTVTTLAGRAGTVYFGDITNFVGTITNLVGGKTNIVGGVTNVTWAFTQTSTAFSGSSLYINYSGVITNKSGTTTKVLYIVSPWPTYTNVFKGKTTVVVLTPNSFTLAPYQVSTVFSSSATYQNYAGTVTNNSGGIPNITVVITNTPFLTNTVNGKVQTNWLTVNIFHLSSAPPFLDGIGVNALFYHPSGLALDGAGNLYVADGATNGVRFIRPDGTVTTLAGSAGAYNVSPAQFGTDQLYYHSSAVAVDGAGNVYVADAANNTIRVMAPGMSAVTIAGSPGVYGIADGTNAAARFAAPIGLALDAQTNLFVADSLSHTIRKITPVGSDWMVITVGGLAGTPGSADGPGQTARFEHPGGVALDSAGNLYVADTGNNTVRIGLPLGLPLGMVAALQISSLPDQAVISWPASASAAGFVLETCTNLASDNWTTVTTQPAAAGGQLMITNDTTSASSVFYRLRKP